MSGATRAASSSSGHQDDELLQSRVARFGLVGGVLGLVAYVFRIPAYFLHGMFTWRCLVDATMAWHAAAAGAFLVVWLLARGAPRSRRFLQLLEGGGLLVSCLCYGAMGRAILQGGYGIAQSTGMVGMIVSMAMSYGLLARATFVPSTALRTVVIAGLSACALLLLVTPQTGEDSFGYPADRFGALIGPMMWWTLAAGLAATISRAMYGLRQEASRAQQYGQYTLVEKIGQGGMGVVYRAQHAFLRRPTAVKLLPRDRTGTLALERFEREVQLTATLTHPNTVKVFDYGRTPDGVFYYAMEYLDGETLQDIVDATGPMPAARVAHVMKQMAGALVEAHEAGLIHRDLKPANAMLCTQGGMPDVVKVLDLGLAHEIDAPRPVRDGGKNLVHPSGTPLYLSPEAIQKDSPVTAASDLYALGAVAYFMLTGRDVFSGATAIEIYAKHVWSQPLRPSEVMNGRSDAALSTLEPIVLACLEKNPAHRPPSARELLRRLAACDVPPWTEDDARAWWQSKGAPVREHHGAQLGVLSPPDRRTLAVDLVNR
ncbi:MAG: serine/threonine-protein kinase [Polyangiales bacterium]